MTDAETKEQLLKLASDYIERAAAIEAKEIGASALPPRLLLQLYGE